MLLGVMVVVVVVHVGDDELCVPSQLITDDIFMS